jgi:hypothetical protein
MRKNEAPDEAIKMIRAAGFKPHVTRNRHVKIGWLDECGQSQLLVIAFSPSDWRARRQSRAMLRRLLRNRLNS